MPGIKTSIGTMHYFEKGEPLSASKMQTISVTPETFGTASEPNIVWESNGGKLSLYRVGIYACQKTIMAGSRAGSSVLASIPSTTTLTIYAFVDNVDDLRVIYRVGDPEYCIAHPNNWTIDNVLYLNSLANAENSIIERDWDETPGETKDITESIGGANAVLDAIKSDEIPFPDLPFEAMPTDHSICHFLQCYMGNAFSYRQLEQVFWWDYNESTSVFKQIADQMFNGYQDPMSSIAGFHKLPFEESVIGSAGSGVMWIGGVRVASNGVEVDAWNYPAYRYTKISYNTRLGETWGTYNDYMTTDVQLYLPYIGTVKLGVEFVNASIRTEYIIDIYTGDLVCTVLCNRGDMDNHGTTFYSVVGRYSGNCASGVIYSRANTQQHAQNIFKSDIGLIAGLAMGDYSKAIGSVASTALDPKLQTEKGGVLTGSSGWLDVQYPYLIIKRGVPKYPVEYKSLLGRPQFQKLPVSACSGFTRFDSIHVDSVPCTDEEKTELESVLKGGFIA